MTYLARPGPMRCLRVDFVHSTRFTGRHRTTKPCTTKLPGAHCPIAPGPIWTEAVLSVSGPDLPPTVTPTRGTSGPIQPHPVAEFEFGRTPSELEIAGSKHARATTLPKFKAPLPACVWSRYSPTLVTWGGVRGAWVTPANPGQALTRKVLSHSLQAGARPLVRAVTTVVTPLAIHPQTAPARQTAPRLGLGADNRSPGGSISTSIGTRRAATGRPDKSMSTGEVGRPWVRR